MIYYSVIQINYKHRKKIKYKEKFKKNGLLYPFTLCRRARKKKKHMIACEISMKSMIY